MEVYVDTHLNKLPTSLYSDYTEQANKYLDAIPIKNGSEFDAIKICLDKFIKNRSDLNVVDIYSGLSLEQKRMVTILSEMIQYPEDYVEKAEHFDEFKDIILRRVAAKVVELQNISGQEKEATIGFQAKKAQEILEKHELMSKAKAPDPFSDAHTISEAELLREANERLDRAEIERFTGDREAVLRRIQEDPFILEYLGPDLQNDREIVLAAVHRNGYAVEFASENLINDHEIVLAAVIQNVDSLVCVSEDLKNDASFILAAIKENIVALDYASDELKNDREFMLAAIKTNANAFRYASTELQSDPVLSAAAGLA